MREALVKYTAASSLDEFLNVVRVELERRTYEGYPARFEILLGADSLKLEGAGDVNVLVIGPDDQLEHIYSCTYRGLFSGSVFERGSGRKFYEEFHRWVNSGKLRQLLTMYFSKTADATLAIALNQMETALTSLAREGNMLLGNLDLIDKVRQDVYVIEEVSRFANEERFVELANRVRESVVRAKLCMFCRVLTEYVVQKGSGGSNA